MGRGLLCVLRLRLLRILLLALWLALWLALRLIRGLVVWLRVRGLIRRGGLRWWRAGLRSRALGLRCRGRLWLAWLIGWSVRL